jgi:hypothetical protein
MTAAANWSVGLMSRRTCGSGDHCHHLVNVSDNPPTHTHKVQISSIYAPHIQKYFVYKKLQPYALNPIEK